MINSYLTLYSSATPKWSTISDLAAALGFENLVSSTISEYLLSQGVSSQYIYEVVEAATLVNYGQDADAIHALEGSCSMAADNAAGVAGGNFLVFENFLNRSNANVYLETPVCFRIFLRVPLQYTNSCSAGYLHPPKEVRRHKSVDGQKHSRHAALQGRYTRGTLPPNPDCRPSVDRRPNPCSTLRSPARHPASHHFSDSISGLFRLARRVLDSPNDPHFSSEREAGREAARVQLAELPWQGSGRRIRREDLFRGTHQR
jgi:Prenylcysteine lyase